MKHNLFAVTFFLPISNIRQTIKLCVFQRKKLIQLSSLCFQIRSNLCYKTRNAFFVDYKLDAQTKIQQKS